MLGWVLLFVAKFSLSFTATVWTDAIQSAGLGLQHIHLLPPLSSFLGDFDFDLELDLELDLEGGTEAFFEDPDSDLLVNPIVDCILSFLGYIFAGELGEAGGFESSLWCS